MNNVIMIFAQDSFNGIGLNGGLPWEDKDDLKFFKESTMNSAVIVGSKTYETLPVLTGRKVIVLTSDPDNIELKCDTHLATDNSSDAMSMASMLSETKDIFVIGGALVYQHYHDWYTHVYQTFREVEYSNADTFIYDFNIDNEFVGYDFEVLNNHSVVRKYVRRNPPILAPM